MIPKKSLIAPLAIFILGLIPTILGMLFKFLHWTLGPITGNYLLAIGAIVIVISMIVLLVVVLRAGRKQ